MKVPANLSCIGIDQEPANVGMVWMTKDNLENVIKLEIKQESQYHNDDDFDDQNQESSDPGILPGMESAMDSGYHCQSLDNDEMAYTREDNEHLVQEDQDCSAALKTKNDNNNCSQSKKTEFKCNICENHFKTKVSLETHKKKEACSRDAYECKICPKVLKNFQAF